MNVIYSKTFLAHHVLSSLLSPFHILFQEHTEEIIYIFRSHLSVDSICSTPCISAHLCTLLIVLCVHPTLSIFLSGMYDITFDRRRARYFTTKAQKTKTRIEDLYSFFVAFVYTCFLPLSIFHPLLFQLLYIDSVCSRAHHSLRKVSKTIRFSAICRGSLLRCR